ncbi:MAG: TonB-dependent receptor, partial [Cyanobacteria bacterium P01_H01_bin.130]
MKGSLLLALCTVGLGWLLPLPSAIATLPNPSKTEVEEDSSDSSDSWVAQGVAVTDIEVMPTVNGLTLTLVSDQALSLGNTRTVGDALVVDVPGATLALSDPEGAEQFAPADGIALVQVNRTSGGLEVRITGSDGPPTVEVISTPGGLSLAVEPGVAVAEAEPDAINLVVTATRTEEDVLNVPRSVTIIDREEVEQQRQLTSSLVDILGKLVPGLGPPTLQNSVRGQSLRGRAALILIDGVPQNPNGGFFTDLNTVDVDLIERIEILRGPSAIYGDGATGGIINIITRSATDQPVEFDVGANVSTGLSRVTEDGFSFGVKAGVAGAGDRLDGRLLLSYDITNSFFDADGDRIPPNGVADTDRFGLLGKVGYNFTDEQRLELTYNYYSEDLDNTEFVTDRAVLAEEDPEKARSIRVGEVDYEEDPQQTNHVVNLTYRHEDLLNSQFDAQLYFRDTELRQRFADLRGNTFGFPELWQTSLDSTEWGARLQFDTDFSDRFSVVWGADYGREENSRPVLISDVATFEDSNALRIVDRRGQTPDFDITTLGLFAQATWELNDQLQLSGGLRYDNFDVSVEDTILAFDSFGDPLREGGDIDADDVSFNVGVIYSPVPKVSLFAN